jgi:hypothetical protein
MTVLDDIKLGRHCHLRTNVFDVLLYFGRARREEMQLRAEIEERVIDFLEIDHIRHAPAASLPYGLQKRVEMARAPPPTCASASSSAIAGASSRRGSRSTSTRCRNGPSRSASRSRTSARSPSIRAYAC